jgi:hypothetical protein
MPELIDPSHPDTSAHNYQAVNDLLDCSDHSPIFSTFTLAVAIEEQIEEAMVDEVCFLFV